MSCSSIDGKTELNSEGSQLKFGEMVVDLRRRWRGFWGSGLEFAQVEGEARGERGRGYRLSSKVSF